MYHDIVKENDMTSGFQNSSAFQYKVSATLFEEQVSTLSGTDVTFTFDDGGKSFITLAAPILEKYNKKGIFFISTKYINTPGFLSAKEVKELELRGHVVGSHSHTHPADMTSMTREEMDREWKSSAETLSKILGHNVTLASIPNGYTSKQLFLSAKQAAFTDIYTSVPKAKEIISNDQRIYGRYVVHRNMSSQEVYFLTTNKNKKRYLYARWYCLNIAKKILGKSYNHIKGLFVK